MLTLEGIRTGVAKVACQYPVRRMLLFGSYADGTSVEESDGDLLVEFVTPSVSLLTLSSLQLQLEEELQVSVDLVHLPLPEKTLLILGEVIELYEKPGPTDSDQNPGGGRGGL